jgi:ribosomal protein S18 acetylase RimI-like enzyme
MEDLDTVRIIIALPEHRDQILHLAEHFYIKSEPVRVAMNVQWADVREGWEKLVDGCLKNPHSHVAINNKNEVVGFRLSRILNLDTMSHNESINDFLPLGHIRTIEDLLTVDWADVLVDEQGKTCKKLLQFLSLSVRPDYGGRGLAAAMCKENMALGKQVGCEWCSVVGSNWMSQRVFEKLEFYTKARIKFEDMKDERGDIMFEVKDPKQIGSRWQIKKL